MLRAMLMSSLLLITPLVSTLLTTQAHAADGSVKFAVLLRSTDWRMELESTESRVTGSLYNRGSPFVDVKLTEKGWQGRFGELVISSTSVKDKGDGKYEVRISTLPAGIFDFTYRVKSNGDIEVSGMGPTGNLNSGGLKKGGRELYVQNNNFNMGLKSGDQNNGRYEGSAVVTANGAFDSGTASLAALGRLTPVQLKNDPVLYTLIYVLPFSN